MMFRYSYLFLLCFIFACQTTQQVPTAEEEYLEEITPIQIEKPMESYLESEPIQQEKSVVSIPVQLNMRDLEQFVNEQFAVFLAQNEGFEENGLKVEVAQLDSIKLSLEEQRIRYLLPLKLNIKKKLPFTTVQADAQLALQFFTDFEIEEDWTLRTQSEVEQYEWLERPRLQLGGISIPAQFVGDLVIERSKQMVTRLIDDEVAKNFSLRENMQTAWNRLHQPIELSSEYATWLQLQPDRLALSPIKSNSEAIEFMIAVEGIPNVHLGTQPRTVIPRNLPPFRFDEDLKQEEVKIHLQVEADYEQIEDLALENLKGEEFESGKYKVRLEDLELYGQDDKLVIDTDLSGSYQGKIYLTGKPFYNKLRNQLDIKNLDFTLNTRNFLHRSAAWLLKSTIRKQIRDNINYYVDEQLETARTEIKKQLTRQEIAPGFVLKGDLDNLDVADIQLTPKGLQIQLDLEGKLKIQTEILDILQPEHTGM